MVSHPNPRLGVITRFVCALMYAMICFIARPSISLSPTTFGGGSFLGQTLPEKVFRHPDPPTAGGQYLSRRFVRSVCSVCRKLFEFTSVPLEFPPINLRGHLRLGPVLAGHSVCFQFENRYSGTYTHL